MLNARDKVLDLRIKPDVISSVASATSDSDPTLSAPMLIDSHIPNESQA